MYLRYVTLNIKNYRGMYLIIKVARNFNELQNELFNLWTSAKNGSPNEAKALLESPMRFFVQGIPA